MTEIAENDAAANFLGSKVLCGPEGEGREDRNASVQETNAFSKDPRKCKNMRTKMGLTSSHARSSHRAIARTWEFSQCVRFASFEAFFEMPAYEILESSESKPVRRRLDPRRAAKIEI